MNTKNIAFFGLGLFAVAALVSCDNIEDSLATPITNPQLPMFNTEIVDYVPYPYINASDPNVGEVNVGYCSVELPDGFTLSGTIQLSPSEDFSTVIETPLTSKNDSIFANVADLGAQYTEKISKDPTTVTLHARTILTAVNGTEEVRIGTEDEYFGTVDFAFTPVASEKIISATYYLVPGNGSEWAYTRAVKMSHSDINQYDDPTFTALITNAFEIGDRWLVMPQDTYAKVYKGESLAGLEYFVPFYDRTSDGTVYGDLDKQSTGEFNADKLPALEVPCEISINAMTQTYTSKAAVENYYATGNGWANWGEHWMPLFTTDFLNYTGFLNLSTEFKFSPTNAWSGDFGAANAPTETENSGIFNYEGTCKDSGDNIKIQHEGLYLATLNVANWKYTLKQTKNWGLIGDFNGWSSDIDMTPSDDLYTWTAELTVTDGQGWKFRANGAWDVNLGGTADALWTNGDNIVLPAGTYTITLDLTTYPATYTAVKK